MFQNKRICGACPWSDCGTDTVFAVTLCIDGAILWHRLQTRLSLSCHFMAVVPSVLQETKMFQSTVCVQVPNLDCFPKELLHLIATVLMKLLPYFFMDYPEMGRDTAHILVLSKKGTVFYCDSFKGRANWDISKGGDTLWAIDYFCS